MNEKNNTGDLNTGYLNTGYLNTGDRNTGDLNTGDRNTGYLNTGDLNTGDRNTGDLNTGYLNTGDRNTGDLNTGDLNTGDRNTGDLNTGDRNTGDFNTTTPETANYFNKPFSIEKWNESEKPDFIYDPEPTTWVSMSDMTDEEKKEHPLYETTEGYLRTNDMKEEWKKAYANSSDRDKELLLALPNFDADVFLEITGVDVCVEASEEMTVEQICAELGRNIKIVK